MRVAVFIATTQGPAAVRDFRADPHGQNSSMLIYDQGFVETQVSGVYAGFKSSMDQLLADEFDMRSPPSAMQLHVDRDITEGDSFQLGGFAVQALAADHRLAFELETADKVMMFTGKVLTASKRVDQVGGIQAKIMSSSGLIERCHKLGKPLAFILPEAHRGDVEQVRASGMLPDDLIIGHVDRLQTLLSMLEIDSGRKQRRRGPLALMAAAAAIAAIIAATVAAGLGYSTIKEWTALPALSDLWLSAPEEQAQESTQDQSAKLPHSPPTKNLFELLHWQKRTSFAFEDDCGSNDPAPIRLAANQTQRTNPDILLCGLVWEIRPLERPNLHFHLMSPNGSLNVPVNDGSSHASVQLNHPIRERNLDDQVFELTVAASASPVAHLDLKTLPDGIHQIDEAWVEVRRYRQVLEGKPQ